MAKEAKKDGEEVSTNVNVEPSMFRVCFCSIVVLLIIFVLYFGLRWPSFHREQRSWRVYRVSCILVSLKLVVLELHWCLCLDAWNFLCSFPLITIECKPQSWLLSPTGAQ